MADFECPNCRARLRKIGGFDPLQVRILEEHTIMKKALVNIANLDRAFVENNGTEMAFCRVISEARKGLGEEVDGAMGAGNE